MHRRWSAFRTVIEIDRPIFIVGPHRSGTTLLYDILGSHPDVGYFNRANRRLPNLPSLAHWLTGIGIHKFRDQPMECQRIWDQYWNRPDDSMDAGDATPEATAWYRKQISKVLAYRGENRFVAKSVIPAKGAIAGSGEVFDHPRRKIQTLHFAVVPGRHDHPPLGVECHVRRMVELDLERGAIEGITQFAGAGDRLDHPVDHAPDAVVVPVREVEVSIGAYGDVLREIQRRLQCRQPVAILTGQAVADDRCDHRLGRVQ